MKIAIIGAGAIGGHLAKQFALAGHDVTITYSQNQDRLRQRAEAIGNGVKTADLAEAVQLSDVLVMSARWLDIDDVIAHAGDLTGKVVFDVTNQFGSSGLEDIGTTVAEYNQARMPGAKLVRTCNMFYASYLAEVSEGQHGRIAMFFAAEDTHAKDVAMQLLPATGFQPIYLGGWEASHLIDMPNGVLLGKTYTPQDAQAIANKAQQLNFEAVQAMAKT